jgi:hypothetical protein
MDDPKNIAITALSTDPTSHDQAQDDGADLTSGTSASPTAASAGSQADAPGAAAPQAQGAAASPVPQDADHAAVHGTNTGKAMLHGILEALGGTNDYQYSRDPETGKMIVTAVRKGPGQQWKQIVAGALKGAAAGASQSGPGSKGRAAGAGFNAGADLVQGNDDRKRAAANEDFDQQQKAKVTQAQNAHLSQLTVESSLRSAREQTEFNTKMDEVTAAARAHVDSDPNKKLIGTYASLADFLKDHKDNADVIAQGAMSKELVPVPIFKDGKSQGVEIYQVTQPWLQQRTTEPTPIVQTTLGKDGEITPTIQNVPAGGMTNLDAINHSQASVLGHVTAVEKNNLADKAGQAGQVTDQDRFHAKTQKEIESIRQEGENSRAAGKGDDKPVYAYDPTSNKTVFTSKGKAKEANMTGIREVKQSDIKNDQHDIRVLNDVSLKAKNVAVAAKAMDKKSWATAGEVSNYLADHPNTTYQELLKSGVMGNMTPQAKTYTIAVLNLRESSMGLQKVLTGSARQNETQLKALIRTLPGTEPDAATVKQKLDNFTQNITMLRQGVPEFPGMDTVQFDPDTHIFSKKAWQAANPKGDLKAAVKAANDAHYTVTD